MEHPILPVLHLGPFAFYTFGLCFGAAVCLGAWLMLRYLRTHNIPVNPPVLVTSLIIAGFLGAKADDALIHITLILHRQLSPAGFFTSGYTYLGCVLGGSFAGAVYLKLNRLPWLASFDAIFCMGPGYALGRIGCFLAGDGDYGPPTSLPWAVAFPHGTVPTLDRVHPTMLYSAAWEVLLFVALTCLQKRHLRPGTLLSLYLIATGTGRFLLELLSRNPVLAFQLTEAQCVSLVFVLAGLLIGTYLLTKKQPTPVLFCSLPPGIATLGPHPSPDLTCFN